MPKTGEIDLTYPLSLERDNNITLLEPFKGSKQHHNMMCIICKHEWKATPLSKRQTFKKYGVGGCPKCNIKHKQAVASKTRVPHLQSLKDRNIEILSEYTSLRSTTQNLEFKNHNCGHTFFSRPGRVIDGTTDCVECGIIQRTETINNWSKENSKQWNKTANGWERYKSEVVKLTEQTYKKHHKLINPKKLKRGKAGIEGAYHLDHIVPKRFCYENNIPPHVCSKASNLQMIGWRENIGSRNNIKGTIPLDFIEYIDDGQRIQYYVNELITIFPNASKFTQIQDIYVSIYDQDTNVVIIILPLSKEFANQKIANTVTQLEQLNIRYYIIFEDELNKNINLVKNKLKYYNNVGVLPKIHGRDCTIREITKEEKRTFLNQYHIQGNDKSNISYGAYSKDMLVAVMTFSKPRIALGYKNKDRSLYYNQWELSRFATNTNYSIPGIASKLLTHFKRNNEWIKIISYADKRWSIGRLYDVLGFNMEVDNPPDYHYVINGERKHRWNYRKDILKNTLNDFDPNLTEYQNMENNGFWRVWDCGTLRYVLHNC